MRGPPKVIHWREGIQHDPMCMNGRERTRETERERDAGDRKAPSQFLLGLTMGTTLALSLQRMRAECGSTEKVYFKTLVFYQGYL